MTISPLIHNHQSEPELIDVTRLDSKDEQDAWLEIYDEKKPLHEKYVEAPVKQDMRRRVTFSADLVTDVWVRPTTTKKQRMRLFYSAEQIKAFRKEYRKEKKLVRKQLEHVPPLQFWIMKTWEYGARFVREGRMFGYSATSFLSLPESSHTTRLCQSSTNVSVATLYAF